MSFDQLTTLLENSINTLDAHTRATEVRARPILLEQPPTARTARRDELVVSLVDLDHQCQEMARISEKLSQISLVLRRRRDNARNFLYPISSIPPEILHMIFGFACNDDDFPDVPTNISHVSSEWRKLALSHNSLWLRIDTTEDRLYRFAHWLPRSSGKPLDITLKPYTNPSNKWEWSTKTLARVRTLSLTLNNDAISLLKLRNKSLNALEILHLHYNGELSERDHRVSMELVAMPALHTICLNRLNPSVLGIIPAHLVEIQLNGKEVFDDEVIGLFTRFVALKRLALEDIRSRSYRHPPEQPPILSSLERLSLMSSSEHDDFFRLFQYFRAPNLQALRVRMGCLPEQDGDRFFVEDIYIWLFRDFVRTCIVAWPKPNTVLMHTVFRRLHLRQCSKTSISMDREISYSHSWNHPSSQRPESHVSLSNSIGGTAMIPMCTRIPFIRFLLSSRPTSMHCQRVRV